MFQEDSATSPRRQWSLMVYKRKGFFMTQQMPRIKILIFLFSVTGLLAAPGWALTPDLPQQSFVPDSQPAQFCMQSFNAYGPAYARDIHERTQWIAAELQARPRCDVIQLQEVWNNDQIDQVEEPLKPFYEISDPNRKERIGVMSLFAGDDQEKAIKSVETHDFTLNSDGNILDRGRALFNVKKAFHVVRASLPSVNEDLYFMNTHLHPTSQAVRLTQIFELLEWRLQHQDLKLFLSGDFNGDEHSLERAVMMFFLGVHDSLNETLGGAYPEGVCTYCKGNPYSWLLSDHVLDYIFFSNVSKSATHVQALDGKINMRGTGRMPLSDHFGLRVQFAIENGKSVATSKILEQRRNYAMEIFAKVEKVLSGNDQSFQRALTKVQQLRLQLQQRQGLFNAYFEKFN